MDDSNNQSVRYVNAIFDQLISYDSGKEERYLHDAEKVLKQISLLENDLHSVVGNVIYKLDNDKYQKVSDVFTKEEPAFDFVLNNIDSKSPLLEKFRDSVLLSIAQRDYISGMNFQAKELAADTIKELDSIKNTKTAIYTDFIAILGIFSALIFSLFGGIDELSSIIKSSFENGVSETIIFSSLVGFSLISLLFLLLHCIGMLSNKNMLACGCENTSKCTHSFFKKFPIFSISTLLCGLIFLSGIVSDFVINQHLLFDLFKVKMDFQYLILTIIAAFCIFILAIFICVQIFKKPKITE